MSELEMKCARELVDANRILVDQGILDAFGHVSVRSPTRSDRFLLARNLAPGMVTVSDIQEFDLDGSTVDPRPTYLERFIHSEIYAARPDVMAVVHSHAPSIIPFTVTPEPLRAIMHVAGFLARTPARFDLRDVRGDGTDLLIRDRPLGAALAEALGDEDVLLMRGHGFVTTATSLKLAVYQAVYLPVNARALMDARSLGPVTYISEAEGAQTATANAGQLERAWGVWRTRAGCDDET